MSTNQQNQQDGTQQAPQTVPLQGQQRGGQEAPALTPDQLDEIFGEGNQEAVPGLGQEAVETPTVAEIEVAKRRTWG